ncbi:MAG: hypothetical protein PHF44_02260 [Candidatus Pacebacteria bacterium]|nr:hypothetical protein [Candidatus Paceibacterota bacterium]
MKKITKIKNKYYSKEILKYLLLSGMIFIAASSPYFILRLMRNTSKFKQSPKRKFLDAFSYLRNKGFIEIERRGHDIKISLTDEGKKRAGKYQIDDLEIDIPKRWDKKWRIIIFDIPDSQRIKRNVFRGKIKEFGFFPLQKSVWVYPYKCDREVGLIRDFLGVTKKDIQVITAEKIDSEDRLKEFFKIKLNI